MKKILIIFILMAFTVSTVFANSYVASRQELWFSDSSYYKTSHHIKIGKNFRHNDYNFFGEIGIGEDLNEGTPVGSGSSFDYLRFGISRTFFNSFRVNLNYRSKMKAHDRDLNWIVINTKYRF